MRRRAVFLDRDGVLNEMVYYPEHGIVDSPFTARQLTLVHGVAEPLRRISSLGYMLFVVSNQPGIAKGHFSREEFERMRRKLASGLAREGVRLDGEYYCLHHPEAKLKRYRVECDCRKPKPGLITRAAEENSVSLSDSFVIGDGLVDVLAGKRAGCSTILLSNTSGLLSRMMQEMGAEPDHQARTLSEASKIIEGLAVRAER
jgi:D-glycero-D-manno-heptose 1,7-bisphosphate phosphatase